MLSFPIIFLPCVPITNSIVTVQDESSSCPAALPLSWMVAFYHILIGFTTLNLSPITACGSSSLSLSPSSFSYYSLFSAFLSFMHIHFYIIFIHFNMRYFWIFILYIHSCYASFFSIIHSQTSHLIYISNVSRETLQFSRKTHNIIIPF